MYLWYINNICRLYLSAWTYIAQSGRKQKNRGLFQIEIQAFWHFKPRREATRCQLTHCSIQQGPTVQQYHCQNIKSYEVNIVDVIIVSNRLLLACYEIIKLLGFVSCFESVGITEWQVMIILKLHTQKKKEEETYHSTELHNTTGYKIAVFVLFNCSLSMKQKAFWFYSLPIYFLVPDFHMHTLGYQKSV